MNVLLTVSPDHTSVCVLIFFGTFFVKNGNIISCYPPWSTRASRRHRRYRCWGRSEHSGVGALQRGCRHIPCASPPAALTLEDITVKVSSDNEAVVLRGHHRRPLPPPAGPLMRPKSFPNTAFAPCCDRFPKMKNVGVTSLITPESCDAVEVAVTTKPRFPPRQDLQPRDQSEWR